VNAGVDFEQLAMSKVERDPRARRVVERDPGGGASSNTDAEAPAMKSAESATTPDDIPAVHVLEAAESAEQRETADLLAGFDRPNRSPQRMGGGERDFVDYYSKKKGEREGGANAHVRVNARPSDPLQPAVGAVGAAAMPRRDPRDVATFVSPRKPSKGVPAWLGLGGVVVLMLGIGVGVAWFAASDGRASAGAAAPSGLVSAATTITTGAAMTAPASVAVSPPSTATVEASAEKVPAVATSTETRPRASASTARKEPRAGASGAPSANAAAAPRASSATSAAEERKPPPRDDFIRDL
jgi:hypothetical protein